MWLALLTAVALIRAFLSSTPSSRNGAVHHRLKPGMAAQSARHAAY
jgi:hypothetical protein